MIAVLIAVGFIAWAALGGRNGDTAGTSPPPSQTTAEVKPTGPVALSYGGLATLAKAVGQPIYWVGAKPHTTYELTQTNDRKVYVRYLPPGVRGGDKRPFLTIGTYPVENAFSVTQAAARGRGATQLQPGHGAVGFYGLGHEHNAYLAFPGSDYQIEVYSPTPGQARRLINRGVVSQVLATVPIKPGANAVTPDSLEKIAKRLGQPIYWAGPQDGVTYELRQQITGRIFVRYLPKGVDLGASGAYLTVGTYPVADAFAATKAVGKRQGNTLLELKGGAVAAYKNGAPTSVYVAYPGGDFQVEVFDPDGKTALELVRSGRIAAIR